MYSNVPYTKTSLCTNVQLNSTNLDFQTITITYALFPPGPSIIALISDYQGASRKPCRLYSY